MFVGLLKKLQEGPTTGMDQNGLNQRPITSTTDTTVILKKNNNQY